MGTRVGKLRVHKHLHNFPEASFANLTTIFIRTNIPFQKEIQGNVRRFYDMHDFYTNVPVFRGS
jgi:hypothetical protein